MLSRRKEVSIAKTTADIVAVLHLMVANVIIALGEYTLIFSFLHEKNPGIKFVFRYLDAPVYNLLATMIEKWEIDFWSILLAAELVIVLSSLIYGISVYVLVRVIGAIL